jgi:hypothetical protein
VLHLPRSFHGPLKLDGYSNTSISASDAVKSRLVTISETPSSVDAFIGDPVNWEQPGVDGMGGGDQCSVKVSPTGRAPQIQINYVDEQPLTWKPKRSSFLGRLWGR